MVLLTYVLLIKICYLQIQREIKCAFNNGIVNAGRGKSEHKDGLSMLCSFCQPTGLSVEGAGSTLLIKALPLQKMITKNGCR